MKSATVITKSTNAYPEIINAIAEITNANAKAINANAKIKNAIAKSINAYAKIKNAIAKSINAYAKIINAIAKITIAVAKSINAIAKSINEIPSILFLPETGSGRSLLPVKAWNYHSNSVLLKAFNKSIQLAIAFVGRDNQKL
ncbi:MAG: hypothetical protein V7K48_00295 [Nostoc sp.]|uniref:hypothetical protein n=1 Tax=Nostoc sp. TaxID=1180 RepID=UPI002FF70639